MTIALERIAILLDVASKVSQWPRLSGIAGLANDELTEANDEALKILEEKAKKKQEEEAKKALEAAKAQEAEEKKDESHPASRRI